MRRITNLPLPKKLHKKTLDLLSNYFDSVNYKIEENIAQSNITVTHIAKTKTLVVIDLVFDMIEFRYSKKLGKNINKRIAKVAEEIEILTREIG